MFIVATLSVEHTYFLNTLYSVIHIALNISLHLLIVGEVVCQQARGVEDGGDGGEEGGEAGGGEGAIHHLDYTTH